MSSPAPPIDRRSLEDLVQATEGLLQRYTAWQPTASGNELGHVLVRVFARLASLVVDRLNQVPDKGFLAFLNLLGLELLPPQPARVPLTFSLAAGSPDDAIVPAGTRVAASPLPGETAPIVFETERELLVIRSQLVAAMVREPGSDLFADASASATGQADLVFGAFEGDRPIAHQLYVGHSLYGIDLPKDVTLHVTPAAADQSWLSAVEWSRWTESGWEVIPNVAPPTLTNGGWDVVLPQVPGIRASVVGEQTGAWLRGRLNTPLPRAELTVDPASGQRTTHRRDLPPDVAFADTLKLDPGEPFHPFDETGGAQAFYLACTEAFSKPGATVTIDLALAQPAAGGAAPGLAWEHWNGTSWQALGQSSPSTATTPSGQYAFGDGTQAFTRDGTVTFRCPSDWATGAAGGAPYIPTAYWLRARASGAQFGPPVPRVARLTLSYAWPLPIIDTILTSVHIARTGLAPELAFTDQVPVDLTKDFAPFGAKPQFNDALYLANDEAFSKPGAQITLHVVVSPPAPVTPAPDLSELHIRWECWDAASQTWVSLGESGPKVTPPQGPFRDETNGFTLANDAAHPAPIRFTLPTHLAPIPINGQVRYWVRARIVQGNYGTEAHYVPLVVDGKPVYYPNTTIPVYQLVPASFQPPSIQSIRIGYDYRDPTPPGSTAAPPASQPGRDSLTVVDPFYSGVDPVAISPGPRAPLPPSPYRPLERVLAENDFAVVDFTEIAATPNLGFHPYRPTVDERPTLYLGFVRPDGGIAFSNRPTLLYFSVDAALYEDANSSGQVVVEPAVVIWEYWDGRAWTRLGTHDETQGFTARGLLTFIGPPDLRRSSEFGQEAFWLRARWDSGQYGRLPRLRRVLTNTMWATQSLTTTDEILGSGTGEADQVFQTIGSPVLPDQIVDVREPEPPPPAELAALEAEEGKGAVTIVADASGRPAQVWVRWHQVPDFYESGPRSRHYVLDRLTGQIRFGNSQRGLVPPVSPNGVRATRYATGGGLQGNRPAGTITQLMTTVPYVEGVTNLEPAEGGAPCEDVESIKVRGPRTLRHRDRAVVGADFEDLASQASTDVARVKAIVAQNSQAAGSVGVIVVPDDAAPQPIPSVELLSRVQAYLEARLTPTLDLTVRGPDWLRVTVTAEIVPRSMDTATDLQTMILSRLAAFLHPLTGGPDGNGWEFGRKPHRSDVYALVERTPGVDYVRLLSVDEAADGDGPADWFLVCSGDHQVSMIGGTDDE